MVLGRMNNDIILSCDEYDFAKHINKIAYTIITFLFQNKLMSNSFIYTRIIGIENEFC